MSDPIRPGDGDRVDLDLSTVDLTDLDGFAGGFPHAAFSWLRRHAPVWFHPPTVHTPGHEGFWVLSRYDDVHAAAGDTATFSSQAGGSRDGGGTLIEDLPPGFAVGVLLNMTDDPRHQRVRSLVTPSVGRRALSALEPELQARATSIVDAAVDAGEVDFLVAVAAELPLQAIAALLGVPQGDRHRLMGWANATLDYDDRDLGESSARGAQASAEMFEYGTWLVEEKRNQPGDDMMSAAVHGTVDDEPLSDLELLMFFNLLIAAGSETTRNSIAVGVHVLHEHPDQWATLQEDRSGLPAATEEILRWASSTAYNRRTATRAVEVGGQPIEPGDKVTLWWSSANRDDAAFDQPFAFDTTRDPNRHLAFGHGGHFCLGAHLARLEIRLLLDALLDRVGHVEPTGPIEWVRSNKHTGVRHQPVRLHARPA